MAWSATYTAALMVDARQRRRRKKHAARSLCVMPPLLPLRILFPVGLPFLYVCKAGGPRRKLRRERSVTVDPSAWLRPSRFELRGLYRVFNDAEYRFYRSNSAPPVESDSPFATNATLPYEPSDTYADGIWYLSATYFNGVIESGFLPIGDRGETYIRLEIVDGEVIANPPYGPDRWGLVASGAGVITVTAVYHQVGTLRADTWAITYTTDGNDPGTPPDISPTVTQAMRGAGMQILSYALPVQAQGTTVKVRLQTRRDDGDEGYKYSEGSTVKTLTADEIGGVAGVDDPIYGGVWPGRLPESLG